MHWPFVWSRGGRRGGGGVSPFRRNDDGVPGGFDVALSAENIDLLGAGSPRLSRH